MSYFSEFYQVKVRDEIAKEFTNSKSEVDDMMAGLHEIRVRRAEKKYELEEFVGKIESIPEVVPFGLFEIGDQLGVSSEVIMAK